MLCEICANLGGGGLGESILFRGKDWVITGGGGGAQRLKSPDFRSSEVGISALWGILSVVF